MSDRQYSFSNGEMQVISEEAVKSFVKNVLEGKADSDVAELREKISKASSEKELKGLKRQVERNIKNAEAAMKGGFMNVARGAAIGGLAAGPAGAIIAGGIRHANTKSTASKEKIKMHRAKLVDLLKTVNSKLEKASK